VTSWRLIIDSPLRGAWNMAVDEAFAESAQHAGAAPTLRLYRWRPACLSLGFAQPPEAAHGAFCAEHGIDLVRRPTGGRAVLHHLELTYSVCARLGDGLLVHDLQATYQTICRALVEGLRALGVPAELSGAPDGGHIRPTEAVPCFIGPAAGEVVVQGRKLVGSAMRRIGDAILQHGAILEDWDGTLQAGCLGLADDRALRPAVVTLADLLGRAPAATALHQALAFGFAAVFGAQLEPSGLSDAEHARAAILARERYAHERWTLRRDPTLPA
jgi:lipoyl(octanoyl) transferase